MSVIEDNSGGKEDKSEYDVEMPDISSFELRLKAWNEAIDLLEEKNVQYREIWTEMERFMGHEVPSVRFEGLYVSRPDDLSPFSLIPPEKTPPRE